MLDQFLWRLRWVWLVCITAVFACAQPPSTATPSSTEIVESATSLALAVAPTHTQIAAPPPTVAQEAVPTGTLPAYPPIVANPLPTAYPIASLTSRPSVTPSRQPAGTPPPTSSPFIFLPLITKPEIVPTAVPTATPLPALDFSAISRQLQADGRELAYNKIGFHVTLMNETEEAALDQWMRQLDSHGVPFFLKSVDNAEPLYKAQELMKESGVSHTLVFRATGGVPDYSLPPVEAARLHWEEHRAAFPPELDPSLVWIETVNELDKNRSEWLAVFALETAQLAWADGFKWAAFGWSSGEPEIEDWRSPAMLDFLRLAGENPNRLAIALHEYSFVAADIRHEFPYKIGRFQQLFDVVDQHNIPRPTVLITEWGWAYDEIPEPTAALKDITWANELYAPHPEIKGAGIWHLGIGCCFAEISEQTQTFVPFLTVYSLTNYFVAPPDR